MRKTDLWGTAVALCIERLGDLSVENAANNPASSRARGITPKELKMRVVGKDKAPKLQYILQRGFDLMRLFCSNGAFL